MITISFYDAKKQSQQVNGDTLVRAKDESYFNEIVETEVGTLKPGTTLYNESGKAYAYVNSNTEYY